MNRLRNMEADKRRWAQEAREAASTWRKMAADLRRNAVGANEKLAHQYDALAQRHEEEASQLDKDAARYLFGRISRLLILTFLLEAHPELREEFREQKPPPPTLNDARRPPQGGAFFLRLDTFCVSSPDDPNCLQKFGFSLYFPTYF